MLRRVAVAAACALSTLAFVPAHAGTSLCRSATVGGRDYVLVCFDLGESGTTVSPVVLAHCSGMPSVGSKGFCNTPPTATGTTGFVPDPSYRLPAVDPLTGSVRVYDGDVGTLWVAGMTQPVHVIGACFGDPTFCA